MLYPPQPGDRLVMCSVARWSPRPRSRSRRRNSPAAGGAGRRGPAVVSSPERIGGMVTCVMCLYWAGVGACGERRGGDDLPTGGSVRRGSAPRCAPSHPLGRANQVAMAHCACTDRRCHRNPYVRFPGSNRYRMDQCLTSATDCQGAFPYTVAVQVHRHRRGRVPQHRDRHAVTDPQASQLTGTASLPFACPDPHRHVGRF
jgi:hypothetical protein